MILLRQRLGGQPGLARLCALFGCSRSAFYQQIQRQFELSIEQELVVGKVLEIRLEQPRIGTQKLLQVMRPFLESHGIKMGRDALFQLLDQQNLLIRSHKKKGPKTTDGTGAPLWPNLLEGLQITAIHQVWATDITYLPLQNGQWCYLMAIVDLFSHKIVGFHISADMHTSSCLIALDQALIGLPLAHQGLIHHSDRGSQYRSQAYLARLKLYKIQASMCTKPQENGVSERLNGILKNELLDGRSFPDVEQARSQTTNAVHIYNRCRPHDSLGGLFPEQVHQGMQPGKSLWKKDEDVNH